MVRRTFCLARAPGTRSSTASRRLLGSSRRLRRPPSRSRPMSRPRAAANRDRRQEIRDRRQETDEAELVVSRLLSHISCLTGGCCASPAFSGESLEAADGLLDQGPAAL